MWFRHDSRHEETTRKNKDLGFPRQLRKRDLGRLGSKGFGRGAAEHRERDGEKVRMRGRQFSIPRSSRLEAFSVTATVAIGAECDQIFVGVVTQQASRALV